MTNRLYIDVRGEETPKQNKLNQSSLIAEAKIRSAWLGYKLFSRKFQVLLKWHSFNAEEMDRIVRVLFPTYHIQVDDSNVENAKDCLLFTMKEVDKATAPKKNKKASGPDIIPTY